MIGHYDGADRTHSDLKRAGATIYLGNNDTDTVGDAFILHIKAFPYMTVTFSPSLRNKEFGSLLPPPRRCHGSERDNGHNHTLSLYNVSRNGNTLDSIPPNQKLGVGAPSGLSQLDSSHTLYEEEEIKLKVFPQ